MSTSGLPALVELDARCAPRRSDSGFAASCMIAGRGTSPAPRLSAPGAPATAGPGRLAGVRGRGRCASRAGPGRARAGLEHGSATSAPPQGPLRHCRPGPGHAWPSHVWQASADSGSRPSAMRAAGAARFYPRPQPSPQGHWPATWKLPAARFTVALAGFFSRWACCSASVDLSERELGILLVMGPTAGPPTMALVHLLTSNSNRGPGFSRCPFEPKNPRAGP